MQEPLGFLSNLTGKLADQLNVSFFDVLACNMFWERYTCWHKVIFLNKYTINFPIIFLKKYKNVDKNKLNIIFI